MPQFLEQRPTEGDREDLEPSPRKRDGLSAVAGADVDGARTGARFEPASVEQVGASRLQGGEVAGHPRVDGAEVPIVMLFRARHRHNLLRRARVGTGCGSTWGG